jgi:two-component system, chemotaxis family, protein-glutamate methylesterase/glutaminase
MALARRTSILIVDDSVVIRSLLRSVVSVDTNLNVIGSAADGSSALRAIESLHPDLVLLDVEMPVMDGLATLRELRKRGHKMPVIMCSSLTRRGATVTIEALASGASDYVAKPSGQSGRDEAMRTLARDLIPRIQALTCRPQFALSGNASGFAAGPAIARVPMLLPMASRPLQQAISSEPLVLVIGVSTGGPAALDVLLPALPANFPLPVLIVQHMPEVFTRLFAERLNGRCRLRVQEAAEGDQVRPGTIFVARGNWHMEVLAGSPPTLHLTQSPLVNHCRPAVDVLFRSAAAVYDAGVLAVVLTGMGSDGMIGCRILRDQGAAVLAQDQATSTVWGMPGAVAGAGLAHKVLPLHDIAPEILRIVTRTRNEAPALREPVG